MSNSPRRRIATLDAEGRLESTQVPYALAGVIVLWRGDLAPEGWRICDGTDGTPDLRAQVPRGPGYRVVYIQKE